MIQKANLEDWIKASDFLQENLSSFQPRVEELHPSPFSSLILWKEENMILGVLFYSILYERAEIDYIAVQKEKRCFGIGQKLLNYFFQDCQEKNVETISLEVSETNTSALQFYQKNKFEVVARRKNYYQKSDALLMIKKVIE